MELTLNHLPVLTWNHLNLNDVKAQVDTEGMTSSLRDGTDLPDGITAKYGASAEEVSNIYDKLDTATAQEAFIAGKFPMYNEQKFATGMGADMDLLLSKVGAATDIYEVAAGSKVEEPILFDTEITAGEKLAGAQIVLCKEGSESTWVYAYAGHTEGSGATVGSSLRFFLEKNAKVRVVIVQMLGASDTFLTDFGAVGEADSELTVTKLSLGAGRVYDGLSHLQRGFRSEFLVRNGYLGLPGSYTDINYNDIFVGKKSKGVMRFTGALFDDAEKVFRGTVDFRKDATGANGDEQEDVLLFGDSVVNKTIPLILGEEEDVEGRHAATIGKLSDEMLFYIRTRGIDEKTAEAMMVRAALSDISRDIPVEEIKKRADERIDTLIQRA